MSDMLAAQRENNEVSASSVVEVRNLAVRFGGAKAVDDVSIRFGSGVTGIIGPNGAGKSTLLNVIAGAIAPSSGRVYLEGRNVTGLPPYRLARARVIRTFQHAQVFGHLSVLDNLLVGVPDQDGDRLWRALLARQQWKQQERSFQESAMELLNAFGMASDWSKRAGELSGGQRRIIEYLRALLAEPRVLLVDEPSVGLAPWLVERLGHDLTRLGKAGCCVLLIEHELELIRKTADRVVGMVQGRPVVDGAFDAVVENPVLRDAYLGRQ